MKLLQLTTLATAVLAVPLEKSLASRQTTACTSPKVRKNWAVATDAEKKSYINAVLCLATKPSRLNISTHTTLYDDFGYVHAHLSSPTQRIHAEPVFLPWHRYFVHIYEKALQECGYTGTAMYWDWIADSGAPSKAAVWDPVLGFGGNGSDTTDNGGKRRVVDGPFRNLRPTYWGLEVDPHYLSRDFAPAIPEAHLAEMLGFAYTPTVMEGVNAKPNYQEFWTALEGGPHNVVHAGIGGSLGDMGPISSPNDPVFFLHHTMVDKLWWQWQQQDPQTRTLQYQGRRNDGGNATLEDVLPMLGLALDGVVKDYMDTGGGALCYTY
ncbi:monooxygenase [Cercophora newfieldiana]|uniref:Monooxygenase n=1 Tax=Cercophora newfieldiana TaxID=92897 RepID=A0AA39XRS0_9PEZI|nr:monooxygenase [Cercophora newfieldiana]